MLKICLLSPTYLGLKCMHTTLACVQSAAVHTCTLGTSLDILACPLPLILLSRKTRHHSSSKCNRPLFQECCHLQKQARLCLS